MLRSLTGRMAALVVATGVITAALLGGTTVSATAAGATATIAGTITDKVTGLAIAGATVSASVDQTEVIASTTSSADGAYSLQLPAGSYHVSVSATEYRGGSDSVQVAEGQSILHEEVALVKRTVVSGRVTEATSPTTGVAGILVTSEETSVVTDEDGAFALPPIDVDPFSQSFLTVTDPTKTYVDVSRNVALTSGRDSTVDVALTLGARLSGVVTTNSDNPVPLANTAVRILEANGAFAYSAVTDADGHYEVGGMQAGEFVLYFNPPGNYIDQYWPSATGRYQATPFDLAAGQSRTGFDGHIDSAFTIATVSGNVSIHSYPQRVEPGATVLLVKSDGPRYKTTTDANGNYSFSQVVSGDYTLRFTPVNFGFLTQWLGGVTSQSEATVLTVPRSGRITGVDIVLDRKYPFTTSTTPTISGSATVGSTLTAVTGSWVPTPDAFTYIWLRDGVAIPKAGSSTYQLVDADAGAAISVSVRGQKGTDTATTLVSAPTAKVTRAISPAPTPVITGTTTVGQRLTATAGTWGTVPVKLTYQWNRDGAAITSATNSTYLLKAEDATKRITVTVTGSAAGYTTTSRTSAASLKVVKPFLQTGTASISGEPVVGRTLTAKTGTWSPTPTAVSYQWSRDGVPIVSATTASYPVTFSDAGSRLTVSITVQATGFQPQTVQVAAHGTTLFALASPPTPQIFGTATVGKTLLVSTPAWKPAPVGLTFQWSRNGASIAGATGTAYALVAADRGATITVSVTGQKSGYETLTRTSPATRTVLAP